MHKLIYTLALVGVLNAIAAQEDYGIYLQSGPIYSPEMLPTDSLNQSELAASQFEDYYYLVLQFYDVPTPQQETQLTSLGISLFGYLPNYAYIAKVPDAVDLNALEVRTILPIKPQYKLSQALSTANYPPHALSAAGVEVIVYPYPSISVQVLADQLKQTGHATARVQGDGVVVTAALCCLLDLAGHPVILFMEAAEIAPQAEGWNGRAAQRVNLISNGPNNGYDGAGVSIAIGDDGGLSHDDFKGRLTDYTAGQGGTHGDMTAGLAVGAGNLSPLGMGLAPNAYLYLYDINGYPHLEGAVANLQQRGVVITSTSYGEACGGVYSQDGQAIDKQIFGANALFHVFSAGNSGEAGCGKYANSIAKDGTRFGNITGGKKSAKNTIAVGNAEYNDEVLSSSSRGPTADGRIKPDICAHGQGNLSTGVNNSYASGGGTSAASPSLAGTAALLYQAYRAQQGGANPSSALIKALLLNTAEDLYNPGPDYVSGWGRVHAGRALESLQNNWYTTSNIANGATRTHTINVPTGTRQLRAMIYWIDPEGLPNAAKALVNDLDITLKSPTSAIFLPWKLSQSVHRDSLEKGAGKGFDRANNMEQVTIDEPAAGNYTIEIKGYLVPRGPQTYFIVYHFLKDELTVTYPAGGDGFVPDETETIRWDALGKTGTFTLEFSADNGNSWQTIATNINPSFRYLDWKVPKITATKALIRVSRNGKIAVSNAFFSIMNLPDFNFFNVGANAAAVRWRKVAGANVYDVYALGSKHMDVIGTTADTSFQLNLANGQRNWYSVRARNTNGATGRRATAKSYQHLLCDAKVVLRLNFDLYPSETFWDIKDATGKIWASGGPYTDVPISSTTEIEVCLPYGCYSLNIYDTYNDGMCCQSGQGSYQLTNASGAVLASGAQFGNFKSHNFCLQQTTTAPLIVNVTSLKNASCAGTRDGAVTVSASGGPGNYTYSWNTGASAPSLVSLSAGTYIVTVSDGIRQATTTINILQPTPISIQITTQQGACTNTNNNAVTASASGGTPPYAYTWSNGSQTSSISGLNAGAYQVTVTDSQGCKNIAAVNVTAPTAISLSFNVTQAYGTNNGAINLAVNGGTPTYKFQWSNGATTEDLNNLGPGTYTVTVTDARGCTASASQRVEFQAPVDCTARGSNTRFEWIQSVRIGAFLNNSGNNGGYGDFTNTIFNANRGSSHVLTLTPGYLSDRFREFWRVWIDYNRDGDFIDADEEVFSADGVVNAIGATFQIPINAAVGTAKMRVSMRYGGAATPCGTFPYGEVEDYTIYINTGNVVADEATDKRILTMPVIATSFHLFPNPARTQVTLQYQTITVGTLQLAIYDIKGQLQRKQTVEIDKGMNTVELLVNDLAAGTYLIKGTHLNNSFVERLVIM